MEMAPMYIVKMYGGPEEHVRLTNSQSKTFK